jgi:hypothetical protein
MQQQIIAARLQTENLLAEYAIKKMQLAKLSGEFCASEYNLNTLLPAQVNLLKEQYEAARAQTLNTRSDGSTVVGNLGGQKALHAQQVASYVQDSKLKVAKIFSDVWITQKTLNDEVEPPASFTNPSVESTMVALKSSVGM